MLSIFGRKRRIFNLWLLLRKYVVVVEYSVNGIGKSVFNSVSRSQNTLHAVCQKVHAKNYTFQLHINWQYLFIYNEIMIKLTHYHRIGILYKEITESKVMNLTASILRLRISLW